MNDGGRLRQYASMANVHEWDPSGKITKIDCAPYDIITDPRLTSKAAYDAELKEKAEQVNQSANNISVRQDHSKSVEKIDTSTHIGRK